MKKIKMVSKSDSGAVAVSKFNKEGMFSNMDSGALCTSDMKHTRYKVFYWVLVGIMLLYLSILIIPCLWMLTAGFKSAAEMNATQNVSFFPEKIDLNKLTYTWNFLGYYKYYVNTFIMAAGCVVADLMVSGLCGYVLSRLKPVGHKIILMLVFCLMLLPMTGTTVPLFMTFLEFPIGGFNMLDTYWPIWLMSAANMFNIILFKTNFDGVSSSLIEAAKIDGASDMQIFIKIMIPLSIPVIITVSLFTFNGQFGNFFWPYLVLADDSLFPLGVQVYRMKNSTLVTDDMQVLGILFSILPQLIIFACFQKHIIGGMNLGGVKG